MITIGIPNIGHIHSETALSLLSAILETLTYYQAKYNEYMPFDFVCPTGGGVDLGRNICAEEAVTTKSDYILFIDADLSFPPETIIKLLALDKDIVGATYNKKRLPLQSILPIQEMPKEPFPVEWMPTGVLLIKVPIFNFLSKPWFAYEFLPGTNEVNGEDVMFCKKARVMGFEVWCDPTIDVKHIGDYKY